MIISDLLSAAIWFEKHGRNTNTAIIGICKRAATFIKNQKAESEKQSQNFKVLVSDHRALQQSFDNLKGLYEAEKAKVEKAKEKCISFAKELQTAKSELKEITEKFNCQQIVYADLSDIIRDKNAEIERLKTAFDYDFSKFESEYDSRIKAEAIKECLEWMLSLFPEDKKFTTISRFTVKQKLKEMEGDTE